jgi:asparagine synthase (glutamine-hydrolysing)
MCGFTGYLLKNQTEDKSKVILEMLSLQKHRGPDDSGILGINTSMNTLEELAVREIEYFKSSPNLIFGFNRLSILDLTPAGHQPMVHHASKVALMMNGEVYNAFDFKPELEAKGYLFKSNSDTEVVLYLYLEYGLEGMLERLNGMFALAIYEGKTQDLFLVRDRLGIKPLYVWQSEGQLAFASEMKCFKALPDFKFELDESQLSEFLLFRNVINNTLFKNIINITPGTYLRVKPDLSFEVTAYYSLKNEGSNSKKTSENELKDTLQKAVERQMMSDVKLGSQLSGGVDSSIVTAFAAASLPDGALESVSIVFEEANFSEKKYIDHVAHQFHLQSHQFKLDASSYLDLIDEAVWHFEQPLNHPNTIGIKLLSKEAKKYVTVLLSGEGADEALAGYGRFIEENNPFLSLETLKRVVKNRSKLPQFLQDWSHKDKRYILQTAYGSYGNAAALFKNFSAKSAMKQRLEIWTHLQDKRPIKKRKYELLTFLPDLLMRQDKMSMAHTIENRVPFLDNEMITASLNCDDHLLIQKKNGIWEGKYLLKNICSAIFGESFAFRNKMGFGIPLKSFFDSAPFRNRWETELLPGIKKRGIFNYQPLQKWMENPKKMTAEQTDAVWLMVGFEIWAKQYLD